MLKSRSLNIICVTQQQLNAISKQLATSKQFIRCQTNAAAAEAACPAESQRTSLKWQAARPFEQMRTVSKLSMVRNFLPGGRYYGLDVSDMFSRMRHDYGDIFLWPAMFGRSAMVVSNNPDDFETVFRNEGPWPKRPGSESLNYYRSELRKDFYQGVEGVIATHGEKWGKFRFAVNPVLMQPKTIKLYLQKMSKVNMELVDRIKEIRDSSTLEVPADFETEINRWTLESVSIVALDRQLGLLSHNRNDPTASKLFKILTEFFEVTADIELKPSMWRYIATPSFKKQMALLDELREIGNIYVEEAKQRLAAERASGVPEKPEKEQSVLEKLLKMDEKIATVMALDLILAGVDTTSSTFVAAMLCLAKNPDKQAKLREEIFRILPKKDSEFTEAATKNMPYLRAVIRESMRTYPLTLGNGRVVQNDVVLSGYQVPKDTSVFMVSVSLLKEDKHYPRAAEFLPERWLRPAKQDKTDATACPADLKASSAFIYLPFGFGPRSCIGKRIVEMELELGIARIIRNFHVEFNHPVDKPFKSLLLNVPNIPLQFKFTDVEK